MNNQKNGKCVSRKGKMNVKVPNHDPAGRNGAVPSDHVRGLKAREQHETKKIEGCYGGLLQVFDTLANAQKAFPDRSRVVEIA